MSLFRSFVRPRLRMKKQAKDERPRHSWPLMKSKSISSPPVKCPVFQCFACRGRSLPSHLLNVFMSSSCLTMFFIFSFFNFFIFSFFHFPFFHFFFHFFIFSFFVCFRFFSFFFSCFFFIFFCCFFFFFFFCFFYSFFMFFCSFLHFLHFLFFPIFHFLLGFPHIPCVHDDLTNTRHETQPQNNRVGALI